MTRHRVAATLAAAVAVGCGDSTGPGDRVRNQDFLAEAPLRIDLNAVARTDLRIEGINGDIDVIGATGTETVSVRGVRQVWSESVADAGAYLDRLQVVVTETGSEILIRTVQPQNTGGRRLVVNYELTVPARLLVRAVNVNGDVAVGGMAGDVEVDLVNGNVTCSDLAGDVHVALVNGAIGCRATMAVGGVIDLRAVNGSLVLDIPRSTSARFAAEVVNGSISTSNLALQDVASRPTSLTGTLGAGQGTIDLQTVNGNILARGF